MKRGGFIVIIADILAFGLTLLFFAYLHHVRPQKVEPIGVVATPAPVVTTAPPKATATPTPEPSATIEPTPTVYPVGDFTATFPQEDTGEDALISYQTDDMCIAVDMVESDGITYYVADIWLRNIELLRTAFADGEDFTTGNNKYVLDIAQASGALLAISGDYCGAHKSGVVVRNGVLYRDRVGSRETCVIYYDGVMETYAGGEFELEAALERGIWQAWSFGPCLFEDGEARTDIDSEIGGKNPRCAIGYYEPGHYCFVVVDGRQKGYSTGMTLVELSAMMKELGCTAAYNMDGGKTAEMVYDGERVSVPTGGGRRTSDIIYIPIPEEGEQP